MGLSLSCHSEAFSGKTDLKILMLGLDDAGKTTILYRMLLDETISTVPTKGFHAETINYKNKKFTMLDISFPNKAEALWKYIYQGTKALIFVVDSSDSQRLELAKKEFNRVLASDELKDVPVIVLANKQDKAVMSVAEIAKELGLTQFKKRKWSIFGSNAVTGDGVYECLEWLSQIFKKKI